MHRPRPSALRPASDVFKEAAKEAADRIRRDSELFEDPRIKSLFARLARGLFDSALDVQAWRRSSAVSRQVSELFSAKLDPLKSYLDKLRIGVAARLVRETDESLSEIGRRVGLDVPRTFRRTFQRVMGVSPRGLRRASAGSPAAGAAESGNVVDGGDPPPEAASFWRRRVTLGLVERSEVDELRRLLRRKYPYLERPRTIDGEAPAEPGSVPAAAGWPVMVLPTGDEVGWRAAATVIDRVLRMPAAERRRALVHGLRFGESEVVDMLHNFGLLRAVPSPSWALRVAGLAVELVESHGELQGEEQAWWRTLAWASLGRVRLAAGDAGGAEEALTFAREERAAVRGGAFPRIDVNLLLLEAGLRRRQRRYQEAESAAGRAVELCSGFEMRDVLYAECHLERADLLRLLGDPARALVCLDGLRREREGDSTDVLARACVQGVVALYQAKAHDAAGDDEAAERHLFAARRLCDGGRPLVQAELDKAEARFRFRAGQLDRVPPLLQSARGRYAELGAEVRAAAVAAELAGVELSRRRRVEARAAAAEALEVLDKLPLHREARIAVRLLRTMTEGETKKGSVGDRGLAELCRALDLVAGEVPSHALGMGSETPVKIDATAQAPAGDPPGGGSK